MQWTTLKQIYDNKKKSLGSMGIIPDVLVPENKTEKHKKILLIIDGVVILGILCLVVWFIYVQYLKKTPVVVNPPLTTEQVNDIIKGLETVDAGITPDVRASLLQLDPSVARPQTESSSTVNVNKSKK